MRTIKIQLPFTSWLFILVDLLLFIIQFIRIYLRPEERKQWRFFLVLLCLIVYNAISGSLVALWLQVVVNIMALLLVLMVMVRKRNVEIIQEPKEIAPVSSTTSKSSTEPDNLFIMNCRKDELSPREIEVVLLLAKGKTYKEIAAALHISVSTVDSHAQNSYKKAGVNNKIALLHKFNMKPGH